MVIYQDLEISQTKSGYTTFKVEGVEKTTYVETQDGYHAFLDGYIAGKGLVPFNHHGMTNITIYATCLEKSIEIYRAIVENSTKVP